MLGAADAVEVAHDGAEAVVGGDGGVVEVLDLLQHRVGGAVGEDVAGDEQDRQAVDMRQRRRRHHVGRARPDRGRDSHCVATLPGLGIGNRRMGHRLLVLAPVGGQNVLVGMQRLTQTGNVAMSEDRPDAFDETGTILGLLDREPADKGLGGGQADRGHCVAPSRTLSQSWPRRA